MGKKIHILVFLILASILSALFLILSFPSHELSGLAWVSLVPLLAAISGRRPAVGFFCSLLCMMVFYAAVFSFVFEVPGYRPIHHIFLDLYLGPLAAFFGLTYCFIWRRVSGIVALASAPFVWVCLEYIRANFGFLAFPWVLLSHSQYKVLPIVQIASITGAYGVSFLIVAINSAVAANLLYFLNNRRKDSTVAPAISRRGIFFTNALGALLVILTLFYGATSGSRLFEGEQIKVAVVQGNIPQGMKWDRRHAQFIVQTYRDLTVEVSREKPDLIVWPESATPGPIDLNRRLRDEVGSIMKDAGSHLLLGSSYHQKLKSGSGRALLNSAFLMEPDSDAMNQRYDKMRLFPFGEYLPMENTIPWGWIRIPNIASFSTGKTLTVFQGPGFRFGVTICWEILFPEMVRDLVRGGSQFIVNITNEAWFGETVGPYHMLSASVFRAVENRVFVVRSANTGISCIIDPQGRVVNRVMDASGKDIFVRGFLTGNVLPLEPETFYMRYGDLLVWMSFAMTAAVLALGFLRRRPS